MLLTITSRSFMQQVAKGGAGSPIGDLLDFPSYAHTQLQVSGINLDTGMLSGWSTRDLERLRHMADKASCPCLVLVEEEPLTIAENDPAGSAQSLDRIRNIARAAHHLGCSSMAISTCGGSSDDAVGYMADQLRTIMSFIERLEINLLLTPTMAGVMQCPENLTTLIKTIGGFRIGALPTFAHAATTEDPIRTLRKLAPYAGAMHATVGTMTRRGTHRDYDLAAYVQATMAVGYSNTLAIDYRGDGDPADAVDAARTILEQAIEDVAQGRT